MASLYGLMDTLSTIIVMPDTTSRWSWKTLCGETIEYQATTQSVSHHLATLILDYTDLAWPRDHMATSQPGYLIR